MFTIEDRDALREHVLRLAEADERVLACAVVGSLAPVGGGDRFSDLDLTFAIADDVSPISVLDDWTRQLSDAFSAVHLVDLERGPSTYRVFLLPNTLQCDLSVTPASQFRPGGPRFRLLFGQTVADSAAGAAAAPSAEDLFGWGVIYALHGRACIARGRVWQAEHCIGTLRDHVLSLACLRYGLPAVQGRGYDDLPAEILARFEATHISSVQPKMLRQALATTVRELLHEGDEANLPNVASLTQWLAELATSA